MPNVSLVFWWISQDFRRLSLYQLNITLVNFIPFFWNGSLISKYTFAECQVSFCLLKGYRSVKMSILFKSKIPPWSEIYPQIKNIIEESKYNPLCVSIPYGFQMQNEIWNPEQLRVVLHVNTRSGHSFVSHHGVGKKNEINIWNFSEDKKPGKSANAFQTITTDLKFLHILFLRRRWLYVTHCSDLSLRIFSAKFHPMSITEMTRTVLCLAYNERRDEIITGIAGGIMTWRFPIGQKDPLIPGQLVNCSFTPLDWVISLTVDDASKQILAISDVRIAMIDVASYKERRFFQKKCEFSFTCCVFFSPASYLITGDKNGSIRAWSTSLNSFPMVTQFLGHTATITKLLVHSKEPLIISSSLDKTIRLWNFDTGTQTFRLETSEEIVEMGLLSSDLLYYHSHHHLKIWSLNLFHSLFTNLSSRIRRWTRVKSPGYPARVLLHSEDGGVRLLSPVHGSELTTVLPITTISADIVDVAHNPRQEKIYLVLSTRDVLVFESDTNPCCAHELWVAESPDEGVCSLAMINAEFALEKGEIPLKSGLLFAGHYNGQISLVNGKDVFMKGNVQAHQGQVTCLKVSASVSTESADSIGSVDRLISYGTECVVRIWKLVHKEYGFVSIQQLARVKLLQPPRDLAMAGSTLCMAMADNNVIMCRVQVDKKECGADIFNATKKTHEFLTHSKDDGHTALINGLSCCSALGLFATSSEDHCVKIWNNNNQLVREMCFDESLCGVCFANSRGDILVGFQSHISLVTILNYLPLTYLKILSKMHFENDSFEEHVQFDDLLKFWYDPDRIPIMPLKASKRIKLEPPEVKRFRKRKKKETVAVKQQKTEDDKCMSEFQKRRESRRLSLQVYVMMAMSRLSKSARSPKDMKLTKTEMGATPETEVECAQKLALSDRESVPRSTSDSLEPVRVFWPYAPDGYIPNSVVRQNVKRRKPTARLIPRVKRRTKKLPCTENKEETEIEEIRAKIRDFWTLWRKVQADYVKQLFAKGTSKTKERKKRKRASKAASSKMGRRLTSKRKASAKKSGEDEIGVIRVEERDEEWEMEELESELTTEPYDEKEDEYEDVSEESIESILDESEAEIEEENKEGGFFDETLEESQQVTSSAMRDSVTSSDLPLLIRIVRKKWYPKLAQRRNMAPSCDEAVDNVLLALSEAKNANTIQDICQEFKNIEREFGIHEDKKVELQNLLVKMSHDEETTIRRSAVRLLGEMEVHRKDAYLTVVRRLVDDDRKTREEGKKALNTLTGVDTMEGLSDLMMKLGVVDQNLRCNDNAVLMELAERLIKVGKAKDEADQEKNQRKSSLGNLRSTLRSRKKTFKAKLRHPKTMRATSGARRQGSILEETASLYTMEAFKNKLKETQLGCKLLQKMAPFRQDIIPGRTPPSRKDEYKTESAEIEGLISRPTTQAVYQSQRDAGRLTISSEAGTIKSLETPVDRKMISDTPGRISTSSQVRTVRKSPAEEMDNSTGDDEAKAKTSLRSPYKVLEPVKKEAWKKPFGQDESTPMFSFLQITKVVSHLTGVDEQKVKLLLLKLRRTKGITPHQITESNVNHTFYNFEGVVESISSVFSLDELLTDLAIKAQKSKEEILRSLRRLFASRFLDIVEWQNYAVVKGIGKIPLKYKEALVGLRNKVFRSIEGFFRNDEPLVRNNPERSRRLNEVLKRILGICALVEPHAEEEDLFSREVSQPTLGMSMSPLTSAQFNFSRKIKDELPPIFVQPSLHHSLGPGTLGQRLLHSTTIRAKALSDCRLHSSQGTQDFVVSSLPHRLSFHTGNKIEGESRFGIMELSWRAGTPLQRLNEVDLQPHNFLYLPSTPVELKDPFTGNTQDHGNQQLRPQIPKSWGVPPLSHRKEIHIPGNRLHLFRAVKSINKRESLAALAKYIKNQNIIKRKLFDNTTDFLSDSLSNKDPPCFDLAAHSTASKPIRAPGGDLMGPERSGKSLGNGFQFCEPTPDMTRDTLLREVSKYYPPSFSGHGKTS